MKTLFLFLISFTLFLPVDTETVDTVSTSEAINPVGGKVDIEVEFGRKRKGCTGFGICRGSISIISGPGSIKPIEKGAFVTLQGGQEGEPFIMYFHKKSMTERTIKTYFSGDYFIMDEGFKEVFKNDKDKLKVSIKQGKYKINKSKEGFKVKFAR